MGLLEIGETVDDMTAEDYADFIEWERADMWREIADEQRWEDEHGL